MLTVPALNSAGRHSNLLGSLPTCWVDWAWHWASLASTDSFRVRWQQRPWKYEHRLRKEATGQLAMRWRAITRCRKNPPTRRMLLLWEREEKPSNSARHLRQPGKEFLPRFRQCVAQGGGRGLGIALKHNRLIKGPEPRDGEELRRCLLQLWVFLLKSSWAWSPALWWPRTGRTVAITANYTAGQLWGVGYSQLRLGVIAK